MTEAYTEGSNARFEEEFAEAIGCQIEVECPYPENSLHWEHWWKGYRDQNEELIRNKQ